MKPPGGLFRPDYFVCWTSTGVMRSLKRGFSAFFRTETAARLSHIVRAAGRHRNDCRVYRCGVPVDLSATEFRVFAFLAANANQTVTREQIIFGVHHEGLVSTPPALDDRACRLRKKLGAVAAHLKTVRGVGYQFSTQLPPP